MGTMLKVENLTKWFPGPNGSTVKALDDVSFTIDRGDFTTIVGHNGSGKTTLLNVLLGSWAASSGRVTFVDQDGQEGDWLARPRRDRAILTASLKQDPRQNTFSSLTVLENFWLAAQLGSPSPGRFRPHEEFRVAVESRLGDLGLGLKLDARVEELSQGQRQLLALEVELMSGRAPHFLFLDEHTASLDRKNAELCMNATERLWRLTRITVLQVTHNLQDAIRYGNRLLVLADGRLVASLSDSQKSQIDVASLLRICGMAGEGTTGEIVAQR